MKLDSNKTEAISTDLLFHFLLAEYKGVVPLETKPPPEFPRAAQAAYFLALFRPQSNETC